MGSPRLWTFGHSTRTAEETVALLRHHGIGRVVDVRSIPGSRKFPWFAAADMQVWLRDSGIEYRRIEALGGRRKRQPVDPQVNAGWTHESFHRYADWTLTDEFEQGLAELAALVESPQLEPGLVESPQLESPQLESPQLESDLVGSAPVGSAHGAGSAASDGAARSGGFRTAVMCAEAVPWRCHRSLIATVLTTRGWQVEHILGPGQTRPHRLGEWGPPPQVAPDGHVTYPGTGTPPLFR